MDSSPGPTRAPSRTVVTSAPGKILLAGGYLVLEPANVGVVVAVDKRFYSTVKLFLQEDMTKHQLESSQISVHVASPQFEENWHYTFDRMTRTLMPAEPKQCGSDADDAVMRDSGNPFIEKTLRVVLFYLEPSLEIEEIHVTIEADNEFYGGQCDFGDSSPNSPIGLDQAKHTNEGSLSKQSSSSRVRKLVARKDGRVVKTGLGSSACLVASLVAAMYLALELDPSDHGNFPTSHQSASYISGRQRSIIAALSQIAHCYAQGKIGSGFDVSAACFGSHIYRRFSKETVEPVLALLTYENRSGSDSCQMVHQALHQCVSDDWPTACIVNPIHLAPECVVQVILADVSGGSDSPGMARKVLQWKNAQIDTTLWHELAKINESIAKLFSKLMENRPSPSERDRLANVLAKDWRDMIDHESSCASTLLALHSAFLDARRHLKLMGELADVPIEPDQQTKLADETMALPGVVGALCPGAGGFDALVCVYVQDTGESVRTRIKRMWAQSSEFDVRPLDIHAITYNQGLRLESLKFK